MLGPLNASALTFNPKAACEVAVTPINTPILPLKGLRHKGRVMTMLTYLVLVGMGSVCDSKVFGIFFIFFH